MVLWKTARWRKKHSVPQNVLLFELHFLNRSQDGGHITTIDGWVYCTTFRSALICWCYIMQFSLNHIKNRSCEDTGSDILPTHISKCLTYYCIHYSQWRLLPDQTCKQYVSLFLRAVFLFKCYLLTFAAVRLNVLLLHPARNNTMMWKRWSNTSVFGLIYEIMSLQNLPLKPLSHSEHTMSLCHYDLWDSFKRQRKQSLFIYLAHFCTKAVEVYIRNTQYKIRKRVIKH